MEVGGYASDLEGAFFYGCPTLRRAVITSEMTTLPSQIFQECPELSEIYLPSTLVRIDPQAFYDCPSISKIKVDAVVPPEFTYSGNNFDDNVFSVAQLIVPAGSVDAYRNASVGKNFSHIYSEGSIIPVAELSFKKSIYYAYPGETLNLNEEIVITPEDAQIENLTWLSSDKSVATVSDGLVTVHSEGSCEITAVTTDGSNLSATCSISAFNAEMTEGKKDYRADITYIFQALGCDPEIINDSYDVALVVNSAGNLILDLYSLKMSTDYDEEAELRREGNKYILDLPYTLENNDELTLLKYNPSINSYSKLTGSHTAIFSIAPSGVITLDALEEDVILGEYMLDFKFFSGVGVKSLTLTPLDSGIEGMPDDYNSDEHYEVYDLNGLRVSDNIGSLAPGFYIVHKGTQTKKIVIR